MVEVGACEILPAPPPPAFACALPNPTGNSDSGDCHRTCCSFYLVLPNPSSFQKSVLDLPSILFHPSYNLDAELKLYCVFFLLQLFSHFIEIACTLPPLGNGARLSSCIPPGPAQIMAHDVNRCSRNLTGA